MLTGLVPIALLLFADGPSGEDTCSGILTGQAVDLTTGEAVPRARLTLESRGSESRSSATDEQGRFRVEGLCTGSITLRVERPDYEPFQQTLQLNSGTTETALPLEARTVERLEDVIVQAPAPRQSETQASTTLDGEALARTRGQNLSDAISQVPGVTTLRSAAGGMGTRARRRA